METDDWGIEGDRRSLRPLGGRLRLLRRGHLRLFLRLLGSIECRCSVWVMILIRGGGGTLGPFEAAFKTAWLN